MQLTTLAEALHYLAPIFAIGALYGAAKRGDHTVMALTLAFLFRETVTFLDTYEEMQSMGGALNAAKELNKL